MQRRDVLVELRERVRAAEERAERAERRAIRQTAMTRWHDRLKALHRARADANARGRDEARRAAEKHARRADAAELHLAAIRAALEPFTRLRFSFDGFSFDPAALVFRGREYGQWRSDHHSEFQAMIDAADSALIASEAPDDR